MINSVKGSGELKDYETKVETFDLAGRKLSVILLREVSVECMEKNFCDRSWYAGGQKSWRGSQRGSRQHTSGIWRRKLKQKFGNSYRGKMEKIFLRKGNSSLFEDRKKGD